MRRARAQAVRRRTFGWWARWALHAWLLLVGFSMAWQGQPVVRAQAEMVLDPPGQIDAADGATPAGSIMLFSEEGMPAAVAIAAAPSDGRESERVTTPYERAAARYGVSAALLKALHDVESSAAGDGCLENLEGSGAVGPFQFKIATFRAYGVDGDGDGRRDICGLVDSLFSAARYLQILGADDDPASGATLTALGRYGTDPAWVSGLARDRLAMAGGPAIVAR